MRQLSLLIKPSSSLCNMRCSYCFYEDVSANRECASMGIMDDKTMNSLIAKSLAVDVEQVNYCFQGGEPTVAGLEYFKKFISLVNEKKGDKMITYAIQTNGILLNHQWIELLSENHFLVGVSLDGFIENHDRFRKDASQKGTFKKIMQNITALQKAHVEYNILTVLTHELAKKPKRLFDFYRKHHFKYVQLIPCLPSLQGNPLIDQYCLTPQDFSSFYKKFFDEWYEEYAKGNYISVTLFDNVIPMYLGVAPQQCGMLGKCQMQLVVEGNGNVYPCDFFVLDEYCCGNINEDSIEEIRKHEAGKRFINEKRILSNVCEKCPFTNMCRGNCKRLKVCYYDENYCGYQEFLSYSKERMQKIAYQLSQSR